MCDASPDEFGELFLEDRRFAHLRQNHPDEAVSKKRSNSQYPTPSTTEAITPPSVSRSNSPEYLTDVQVAQRYGVSRATVWRWAGNIEGFPPSLKLSKGTTRWAIVDLLAFEKQRDVSAKNRCDLKRKRFPSSIKPRDA